MKTPLKYLLRRTGIVPLIKRIGLRKYPQPKQKSLRDRVQSQFNGVYPTLHYDGEPEAQRALKIVDDYTMSSYQRMITLWQQVRYLDEARIPGCFVECGTWRGGSMGMMALAHLSQGTPYRPLHLFDSFEGLPEPNADKDGAKAVEYSTWRANGELKSINQCVGALADNQYLLSELIKYPKSLTRYHVGWFQDTLPKTVETT